MSPRASSNLPGISLLEQTPIIIEKILLDVPDATLGWKPAMDRWSISEVLAHMTEYDQIFRERIRKIAQENNPAIDPMTRMYPTQRENTPDWAASISEIFATSATARFPCCATFRKPRWAAQARTRKSEA